MVIIIYSSQTASSVQNNIGAPDYSYYFVLKKFREVLCKFATIVEIKNPERDADIIYKSCQARKEPCLFFSFTPPFKTAVDLQCPTISIFAWEYLTIPTDTWDSNPRNDWRYVFRKHGRAITHSSFTVKTVKKEMGNDFPIWSIPAPVWDDYTKFYQKGKTPDTSKGVDLTVDGTFIDLHGCHVPFLSEDMRKDYTRQRTFPREGKKGSNKLHLSGIVYTAVFNPGDHRKNWGDLIKGYIWAFRESEDVTLILKAVHHDFELTRKNLTFEIYNLTPFKCRVVILHGYLQDDAYAGLVGATTYVVNTAYGEGQCLPLMEFMSAGKPAIAPTHTAMEDYIREDNAFVVQSSLSLMCWPQDPRCALRTMHFRTNWESLYHAYLKSYHVAKNDPVLYTHMSDCAVESLKKYCSKAVVEERLKMVFRACGVPDEILLSPTPQKKDPALFIPLLKMRCFHFFSTIPVFLREMIDAGLLRVRNLLKIGYGRLKT
jgi:glycosyltransferase involved in cell wall biosynthesis